MWNFCDSSVWHIYVYEAWENSIYQNMSTGSAAAAAAALLVVPRPQFFPVSVKVQRKRFQRFLVQELLLKSEGKRTLPVFLIGLLKKPTLVFRFVLFVDFSYILIFWKLSLEFHYAKRDIELPVPVPAALIIQA